MGLSPATSAALRAVVAAADDQTLARIHAAACQADAKDLAATAMRGVLQKEVEDRVLRDAILAPLRPLARPDLKPPRTALINAGDLQRVWRLLKERDEDRLAETAALFVQPGSEEQPQLFDRFDALCRSAAGFIRSGAAISGPSLPEAQRAERDAIIATLLDLTPLLRRARPRLAGWLRSNSAETVAAMRLMFRDAAVVGDEGGVVIMEALLAYLDDPADLLRIISRIMDRPSERFLVQSELGPISTRLLEMVRGRVAARKTSPAPQDASEAKREAVLLLETINGLLLFEEELELDGPWKKDVATEKRVLVAAIERDLRAAPQAVAKALDAQIETVQTGSRLALVAAHGQTPDPVKTQAAQARLVYLDEMRHAAALLGFGTLRSGVLATVQSHIESYVDDLITRLRVEGDLGRATIQAYLASAADLMEIVSGRNAAQLVRRRGATAVAA